VAVLSPGVFAEIRKQHQAGLESAACEYLATVGAAPSSFPTTGKSPSSQKYRCDYRTMAVVSADSSFHDVHDLRRAAEQRQLQFLFVHPLSVSRRIAPEFALRKAGISPPQKDAQYTWSHSNSLRLLMEAGHGRERVAFVWEGAIKGSWDQVGVRKLDFPELETLAIPQDVVVARSGFRLSSDGPDSLGSKTLERSVRAARLGCRKLSDVPCDIGNCTRLHPGKPMAMAGTESFSTPCLVVVHIWNPLVGLVSARTGSGHFECAMASEFFWKTSCI